MLKGFGQAGCLSHSLDSVRPSIFTNLSVESPAMSALGGGVGVVVDADDVRDLTGLADLSDPIVGYDVVFSEDNGPGALAIRPLPSPREPTPAETAKHCLSHLPYASWCPFCVAFRRPNNHHRRCRDPALLIPLLVGDYAFVRNSRDEVLLTLLAVRLHPSGLWFVCGPTGRDSMVLSSIDFPNSSPMLGW